MGSWIYRYAYQPYFYLLQGFGCYLRYVRNWASKEVAKRTNGGCTGQDDEWVKVLGKARSRFSDAGVPVMANTKVDCVHSRRKIAVAQTHAHAAGSQYRVRSDAYEYVLNYSVIVIYLRLCPSISYEFRQQYVHMHQTYT